jgi:PAS domain S-box-containing protein
MHRNEPIAPFSGGEVYRDKMFGVLGNAFSEKESLYRYAIELSHQIPWVSDTEGKILFVGPGWAEAIGHPLEDLLGYGWLQFVHPDDAARLRQARRETLTSGASYECEYRIRTADGHYRWFRSSAGSRRDESGTIILWYGTTQDIHDRKLAELTHQGHTRVLEMVAAGRSAKS